MLSGQTVSPYPLVPNPMIALSLFRNPVFAAANVAKIACYLGIMAGLFLAPFYFQRALGFTPGETGRAMLPFPIALSLASLTMGPLSDRIGWRVSRKFLSTPFSTSDKGADAIPSMSTT